MTDTSNAMRWLVGAGAIIAVGTPMFIGGQYVTGLTYDMQAANREVANLKGQVEQLQQILATTTSSDGMIGPKGDQGLEGPPGPAGPVGPAGPAGISGLTEQQVVALIASYAPHSSGQLLQPDIGIFSTADCIPTSNVVTLDVLVLKRGLEFCGADGGLLTTVAEIYDNSVRFESPGYGTWSCSIREQCEFAWDKDRRFYVDRISEEMGEDQALLRFGR